jgi:hypothetical protein
MLRKAMYGAAVVAWSWVLTAPALAQGRGERVGENISHLVGGWARSLYVGVAAIVAIIFLVNRRFADLAIFIGAAVIVGGFVLAPNDVAGTVRDIWRSITG